MKTPDETYPRPIATVDLAILALVETGLEVLLMRRGAEPFAGRWALPGGWVHVDEDASLAAAARRVLTEKTGVETPYLEQLQTFGTAARDPRGWSISISYVALVVADQIQPLDHADPPDVEWRTIIGDAVAMSLPFDHADILRAAVTRLRNKVEYTTLPVHLLPEQFTLSELQSVYERILDRLIDKSAFRKRIAAADFVTPVRGEMRRGSNRPAQLYKAKPGRELIFFDRTI